MSSTPSAEVTAPVVEASGREDALSVELLADLREANTKLVVAALHARELAAEAAQANALFNAFPDPIARYDRQHRHLFLNDAMEQATGLSRAAMLGRTPAECEMPGLQRVAWTVLLARVFENGNPSEQLVALDVVAGVRSFHVRALPERDDTGDVTSCVVIARDVTESELHRTAREDADRLHRIQTVTAAFSLAPTPEAVARVLATQLNDALAARSVSVVVIDPRSRAHALSAWTGPSDDAITRLSDLPDRARSVIESVIAKGQPSVDETTAVFPLARARQVIGAVLVSFHAAHGLDPAERAFVLSLAQHSAQAIERAQLLRAEREARVDAEAANRLKDEFVATMSHELRTPLNAVLGWTTVLSGEPIASELVRRGLKTIDRNARAQAKLIEDVLDVSRLVNGKLKLDRSVVDVAAIAADAIDVVRAAADAKHIGIRVDADGPSLLLADEHRLKQIVWNLVSNAVKFTPEGGSVEVSVRRVTHGVELVVRDDGAGIPREFLPFVFERFRQLDGSSTRHAGGLGLGLAIVRHLVELHGGTVKVASDGIDRGATFVVVLPGDPHEASELLGRAQDRERWERDLAGIRIHVFDDDDDSRELVSMSLDACGATVTKSRNAEAALRMLAAEMPDILVCGLGMPGMDGFSVLEKLRALPGGGSVPGIAVMGSARPEDERRARIAGFDAYLAKPVDRAELVGNVATLARSSRRR